jgi:Amt family ammonium transporter
VIDYSGGYVIHVSSGTAGFVGAWWIGPRLKQDRENFKPHNILLALVGCGILWVGWNGFNGGDPYTASPDAGAAVLNTNIATAVSLLTWTALDVIFFKKPAVIGAIQGMITGLVAITPAAGKTRLNLLQYLILTVSQVSLLVGEPSSLVSSPAPSHG